MDYQAIVIPLIHKPPSLRLVIAHQVVMQPRLFIKVLVLQPERLMCIPIDPPILFQTTPGGVFTVPEEIAVLARDADFVAVEVVGLLAIFAVFVGPVAYLCQGVVAVVL